MKQRNQAYSDSAGNMGMLGGNSGPHSHLDNLKGGQPSQHTQRIKDATDCMFISFPSGDGIWLVRVPPNPNAKGRPWGIDDVSKFVQSNKGCIVKQVGPKSFTNLAKHFGLDHLIEPLEPGYAAPAVAAYGGKGATCIGKRCPEPFHPWAEPNQPNGTFICYSCRNSF